MSKKILLLPFLLAVLFVPVIASAQYGLDETAGGAGLDQYGSSVSVISGNIIGSLLSFIGVIFFILTVYAGVLWMTARGQEDVIKKAQNTLIAAVIGLTITIGSYAITNFILGSAGGGGNNDGKTPAEICSEIQTEDQCLNTNPDPNNPGVSCTWAQEAGVDQGHCEA
ncbi:MAG: hypothetical protein COU33_02915 [Candidatus Magasanikbacteria bacterium CG10_big_fil_rev_8_21_14_0_10_43_6]|uniref:TrbC/VirB2 family protein n=1 Tax=Candidatus Magasanikbacteria bacterium CG10_big_fil_rev_8_21_14_0_10_43_6 TaxID=1974650 RepID=A0A2M6W0Z8_9BACT|nr:MAG: hypothetical protein COU33_02915 [Candidatus Magasanikbacteria bacterium CG10_big_fil_rev_8_21_14_0_10_43_6]